MACSDYRPDHNGECLNCDEPANAHQDDARVRWFGPSWGAFINKDCIEAPTPVGRPCLFCRVPIAEGDQGILMWHLTPPDKQDRVPAHLKCFLRDVGVDPE